MKFYIPISIGIVSIMAAIKIWPRIKNLGLFNNRTDKNTNHTSVNMSNVSGIAVGRDANAPINQTNYFNTLPKKNKIENKKAWSRLFLEFEKELVGNHVKNLSLRGLNREEIFEKRKRDLATIFSAVNESDGLMECYDEAIIALDDFKSTGDEEQFHHTWVNIGYRLHAKYNQLIINP